MKHPDDTAALAKGILTAMTRARPVFFAESESLFDDLSTAYTRRKTMPQVYEWFLREARTRVEYQLRLGEPCDRLLSAAIRSAPRHLWDWPATGSDSPRLHHRLAAFLMPRVMREIVRGIAPIPALEEGTACPGPPRPNPFRR